MQDLRPGDLAQWGMAATLPLSAVKGGDMSSEVDGTEIPSDLSDSHVPGWLVRSLIVMTGCAVFTLLAYLLSLWTS